MQPRPSPEGPSLSTLWLDVQRCRRPFPSRTSHRSHRWRGRVLLIAILSLLPSAPPLVPAGYGSSALASGLPHVYRHGDDLAAASRRFQAWGFNYGVGDRYLILSYFDQPTEGRLRRVVADMREARSLGANTLRVYLEIKAFMSPSGEPRQRALDALAALLERAERLGVYLDITGNLVWRTPPAWYDALSETERWEVQARFWAAVARTAHNSPAVLVYELTSEPTINGSGSWYQGLFGGYTFNQNIVLRTAGRDPNQLARSWIRLLRRSIRHYDRRHLIGIGLLPTLTGPFAPSNVADLLDVLLVHVYPEEGEAAEATALVHGFAEEGAPVILGETAPIFNSAESQETFLLGSRRDLDGYLSFYDGRRTAEVGPSLVDALYAAALDQFVGLRDALVGG